MESDFPQELGGDSRAFQVSCACTFATRPLVPESSPSTSTTSPPWLPRWKKTGFRNELKSDWDIYDLGLVIEYDPHTISLSQHAFIDRVIGHFGQNDVRPIETPMVAGLQLRRLDKSVPDP
jgi:hypothetical protein